MNIFPVLKDKTLLIARIIYDLFDDNGTNIFAYIEPDVNGLSDKHQYEDEEFEVDFMYSVFKGVYYLYNRDKDLIEKTTDQILENEDFVDELKKEMDYILRESDDTLENTILKTLIYQYKYTTVRQFFQKNYRKFLPEFDYDLIKESPQRKILVEAFMAEFDKLVEFLDYSKSLNDITQVREDYMYYLSDLIGNERDETFSNAGFRRLASFIIDIYRIKGSYFSYELYFSLLGYNIEIREYFFDKRLFNPSYSPEENKRFGDKNEFGWYLTTQNPIDYIPQGLTSSDYVLDNEYEDAKSLLYFNYLMKNTAEIDKWKIFEPTKNGGYGYTYFKTNYVTFDIIRDRVTGDASVSAGDIKTINRYIDFLTPIFVLKNLFFAEKAYLDKIDFNIIDSEFTYQLFYLYKDFLDNFIEKFFFQLETKYDNELISFDFVPDGNGNDEQFDFDYFKILKETIQDFTFNTSNNYFQLKNILNDFNLQEDDLKEKYFNVKNLENESIDLEYEIKEEFKKNNLPYSQINLEWLTFQNRSVFYSTKDEFNQLDNYFNIIKLATFQDFIQQDAIETFSENEEETFGYYQELDGYNVHFTEEFQNEYNVLRDYIGTKETIHP